jgi:hypothetical protein
MTIRDTTIHATQKSEIAGQIRLSGRSRLIGEIRLLNGGKDPMVIDGCHFAGNVEITCGVGSSFKMVNPSSDYFGSPTLSNFRLSLYMSEMEISPYDIFQFSNFHTLRGTLVILRYKEKGKSRIEANMISTDYVRSSLFILNGSEKARTIDAVLKENNLTPVDACLVKQIYNYVKNLGKFDT